MPSRQRAAQELPLKSNGKHPVVSLGDRCSGYIRPAGDVALLREGDVGFVPWIRLGTAEASSGARSGGRYLSRSKSVSYPPPQQRPSEPLPHRSDDQ